MVTVQVTVYGQRGPIAGTLCRPPRARHIQVIVHGWTYDQHYFDWRYRPATYSYARKANTAGYATLSIDRLGAGASWRPMSLFHTFQADVATLHQLIQALRRGDLGVRYAKVIGVGHSLGSMVVSHEAGQFKDLDAIITTGFSHSLNFLSTVPRVALRSYPAPADLKFVGDISDPAYVTSIPGTRQHFYNAANTDPKVIAEDERLKSTDSLVELATLPACNVVNVDRDLNIPVLAVNGQKELFFCRLRTAPPTVRCSSMSGRGMAPMLRWRRSRCRTPGTT